LSPLNHPDPLTYRVRTIVRSLCDPGRFARLPRPSGSGGGEGHPPDDAVGALEGIRVRAVVASPDACRSRTAHAVVPDAGGSTLRVNGGLSPFGAATMSAMEA